MRSSQAGRPSRERATLELLDVADGALRVYKSASSRIFGALSSMGLRHQWVRRRRTDNGYRALVDAADDLVTMWNAGATEAELRPFARFLPDVLDSVSTGCAVRPLSELDQTEQQLEAEETSLQMSRLVREAQGQQVGAADLIHEADIAEQEASVELEKGRALRRRARQVQLSCLLLPVIPADSAAARDITGPQVLVIAIVLIPTLWALVSGLRIGSRSDDAADLSRKRHRSPG